MTDVYFTVQEADLFTFYRIPKELFTNPKYKDISAEAKILYGLLLDRNSLSVKNGWVDERGYIYIYFSREEVMEILSLSDKPVSKIFRELKEVDLIEEKRQGLGKANIIFVKKFVITTQSIENKGLDQNRKNYDSGIVKIVQNQNRRIYDSENGEFTVEESENLRGNNTNINNTDMSNKNQSVSPSVVNLEEPIDRPTDTFSEDTALQKELERILHNGQVYLYQARLFIESVIKKLYTDRQMPCILKMGLTHQEIKDRLRLLTYRHIDVALTKMSNVRSNKELYFAKCLLTAIMEVDLDELLQEKPPEPKLPPAQKVPQRDTFEQRQYSDEELAKYYANLT